MDSMSKLQLKYASPVIRVYEDGHVERLKGTDREPPDIIIETISGVSVRLYLPEEITSQPTKKLPILIYYHGGGFCTKSVSSPTYHNYLNSLAFHAKVLGVSVEYRLAPEFPLPTAFNDSWTALQWVLSHVNGGDEQ
ncbi:tuliposide A-converting enzyme b1, amyloplastic-like [Dioscorea cayenensis subsp. rotundata]|uniref:Tuliposide A-converting enzyme b1, amyloplastic-like n=1 Tax=Dioscorea cayennensis subsp. rotundata TaxID=55577 RepID=A0AB40B1Q2_DIOCR|nr:tuliposide A-converting enzyme b1, amyloplastic-like [Dioscorea cayenensis subsp. rotundata]